jgi:hypothetical protein
MAESPPREANSGLTSQEVADLLWNTKVLTVPTAARDWILTSAV